MSTVTVVFHQYTFSQIILRTKFDIRYNQHLNTNRNTFNLTLLHFISILLVQDFLCLHQSNLHAEQRKLLNPTHSDIMQAPDVTLIAATVPDETLSVY